jgi:hypothetical protein
MFGEVRRAWESFGSPVRACERLCEVGRSFERFNRLVGAWEQLRYLREASRELKLFVRGYVVWLCRIRLGQVK